MFNWEVDVANLTMVFIKTMFLLDHDFIKLTFYKCAQLRSFIFCSFQVENEINGDQFDIHPFNTFIIWK